MGKKDVINRGRYKDDKMVYDAKGTWVRVDYNTWRNEVAKNPTGKTAQRARESKDPDLGNLLSTKVIEIKHGTSVERQKELDSRTALPLINDRTLSSKEEQIFVTREQVQRRKELADMKSAEVGRGLPLKYNIPMLEEEEKKDGKKSKEKSKD